MSDHTQDYQTRLAALEAKIREIESRPPWVDEILRAIRQIPPPQYVPPPVYGPHPPWITPSSPNWEEIKVWCSNQPVPATKSIHSQT